MLGQLLHTSACTPARFTLKFIYIRYALSAARSFGGSKSARADASIYVIRSVVSFFKMHKCFFVWILFFYVGGIAGEEHTRLRAEVRFLNNEISSLKNTYQTEVSDLKKEISNLK